MKVRYSPRALAQLDEIHKYIAQHNPRAVTAVVVRIGELCEKLGELRMVPVVRHPYLIFYAVIAESNEVRILRIRHGRRRPLIL